MGNGPCQVCQQQPWRYTCPRCRIHSCSVDCVKRHKHEQQCSGERDKTAFVARRDYNENHMMNYTYLEDMTRRADTIIRERIRKIPPRSNHGSRQRKFQQKHQRKPGPKRSHNQKLTETTMDNPERVDLDDQVMSITNESQEEEEEESMTKIALLPDTHDQQEDNSDNNDEYDKSENTQPENIDGDISDNDSISVQELASYTSVENDRDNVHNATIKDD